MSHEFDLLPGEEPEDFDDEDQQAGQDPNTDDAEPTKLTDGSKCDLGYFGCQGKEAGHPMDDIKALVEDGVTRELNVCPKCYERYFEVL